MWFFHLISLIVLCVATDHAMGMQLKVDMVDTKIYPGNGILSTKVPITDGQPITYLKSFGRNTLYYAVDVKRQNINLDTIAEFGWDVRLDVCENFDDGSWEDLTGQMIRTAWFPGGSCPVIAGNYTLSKPAGPIEVDLREMRVGHNWYVLDVQVGYSEDQLIFSTLFPFVT